MKQNLLGAFIYNSIGIPVAAGILWPFTGTLLNPVVAGAAMALSSITVVSNANRLLRFKLKEEVHHCGCAALGWRIRYREIILRDLFCTHTNTSNKSPTPFAICAIPPRALA